jgi:hypothetical protein
MRRPLEQTGCGSEKRPPGRDAGRLGVLREETKRRSGQPGFALLMTLVLVLLAGVALVGLARFSAARAVASQAAVERLQRRWAVESCRATLLGRVEDVFKEAERLVAEGPPSQRRRRQPAAELRVPCRLAGIRYELVLTDEQAKLNVNRLLADTSATKAEGIVADLMAAAGVPPDRRSPVRLRPLAFRDSDADGNGASRSLVSYGQVFEGARAEGLAGDGRSCGLAGVVTCWGDGKVNLRRACDEVIRRTCRGTLGQQAVGALLAARRRDPYRPLREILNELDGIDARQKRSVSKVLTSRSSCHGLWVIARGARRSWYTLAVASGVGRREFEW